MVLLPLLLFASPVRARLTLQHGKEGYTGIRNAFQTIFKTEGFKGERSVARSAYWLCLLACLRAENEAQLSSCFVADWLLFRFLSRSGAVHGQKSRMLKGRARVRSSPSRKLTVIFALCFVVLLSAGGRDPLCRL